MSHDYITENSVAAQAFNPEVKNETTCLCRALFNLVDILGDAAGSFVGQIHPNHARLHQQL